MAARVVVVGLGPGDPGLVTAATLAEIERIPVRFVRTTRHPSVGLVGEARSFDHLYESAPTFEVVYTGIVEALVASALEHGEVLYAVPGSPLVAERAVELLRADPRVEAVVLPALSFAELAWVALGVDPLAAGARLVDGRRFAVEAAGSRGPLLVGQVDDRDVLSEVKLAVDPGPTTPVTVLQRLGLPDQSIHEVAWDDLDRDVEPDHLTALWIPELAAPVAAELVRFEELVRTLRARCPWDREQTHASLTRHLLEESHEVLEAIDALDVEAGEGYEDLEEELGDLLFQVVFHATIAAEAGQFTLADVARTVHDKLVLRHPHVFAPGDDGEPSVEELLGTWEQRKLVEKGRASLMDGIPVSLPALALAQKVQKKAAGVGFDAADAAGFLPKLVEELDEVRAALEAGRADEVAAEVGDLLFTVVNVARHLGVDAEGSLRQAAGRFRSRFEGIERLAAERGVDLASAGLPALDALWDEVKASS